MGEQPDPIAARAAQAEEANAKAAQEAAKAQAKARQQRRSRASYAPRDSVAAAMLADLDALLEEEGDDGDD